MSSVIDEDINENDESIDEDIVAQYYRISTPCWIRSYSGPKPEKFLIDNNSDKVISYCTYADVFVKTEGFA